MCNITCLGCLFWSTFVHFCTHHRNQIAMFLTYTTWTVQKCTLTIGHMYIWYARCTNHIHTKFLNSTLFEYLWAVHTICLNVLTIWLKCTVHVHAWCTHYMVQVHIICLMYKLYALCTHYITDVHAVSSRYTINLVHSVCLMYTLFASYKFYLHHLHTICLKYTLFASVS